VVSTPHVGTLCGGTRAGASAARVHEPMSDVEKPELLLDPATLAQLRHALRERGQPSLPPPPPEPGSAPPAPASADDVHAAAARVAPICELLFLMMSADGHCDDTERELLRGAMRALTDGQLRSAVIEAMLAEFERALVEQGRAARVMHVTAQLSGDRADAEAAFALAAAIALADDVADPREVALLNEVGELLGLSEARQQELIGGR